MAREFAKSFYRSKEWEGVRRAALIRDGYLCTRCGGAAEEVHHIIHLTPETVWEPRVSLNLDNVTSLCRACHFAEHAGDKADGIREKAGVGCSYVFDANGYVVEKAPPAQK